MLTGEAEKEKNKTGGKPTKLFKSMLPQLRCSNKSLFCRMGAQTQLQNPYIGTGEMMMAGRRVYFMPISFTSIFAFFG